MLKLSVEKLKVVVRVFFMYWEPKKLTIPMYVCMGTGDNSMTGRKEKLQKLNQEIRY